MLGQVALTRGYIALYCGDIEGNIEWCRQALDLLPEAETGWWASPFLGTARAYLVSGEATSAVEERVEAAIALARASGNLVMSSLAGVKLPHFSSRKRHKAKNGIDRQYKKSWSNIPLRAARRKIEREPSSSPGKHSTKRFRNAVCPILQVL